MTANEAIVVLVTAGSTEEAERIARALVEERLAACVNLVPGIRSIYRWKGKIADDGEILLVAKTRRDSFAALERRVRELHSYDVPEVLGLAVTDGSAGYLRWLAEAAPPQGVGRSPGGEAPPSGGRAKPGG